MNKFKLIVQTINNEFVNAQETEMNMEDFIQMVEKTILKEDTIKMVNGNFGITVIPTEKVITFTVIDMVAEEKRLKAIQDLDIQ